MLTVQSETRYRRLFSAAGWLGCFLAVFIFQAHSQAAPKTAPDGDLIIKFRADAGSDQINAGFRHGRLKMRRFLQTAPMRAHRHPGLVLASSDLPAAEALAILRKDPAVEYAERNIILHHQSIPDDPYYLTNGLWGMYGGSTIPANTYGSGAAQAWADGYTGSNSVYVAIIDDGMEITHPDLISNVWTNQFDPVDGIDNDGNGYVDDIHGWNFVTETNIVYRSGDSHGTHVAGIIGARGGNGIGVAGVNWNVTLIPLKFITNTFGSTLDAVEAVDYCVDLKQRHGLNLVAINASWGGDGYSESLHDAVIRAAKAGILFVAAAGNSSTNNDVVDFTPANLDTSIGTATETAASFDSVITVAALDSNGGLASYSNYGHQKVHLGAPGSGIYSTFPNSTYASLSGTSMAAPHVTGAVALYASTHSTATPQQIRSALLQAVTPTASLSLKTTTGGRLNLASSIAPPPPGTAQIANAGFSIISETCTNGAVDPDETVTLRLWLTNSGVAATTALAATLQADSGVVSPSASQDFGVLLPGGSAVAKDFTFTAEGTCGQPLVLTFDLQDAGIDIGTATVSLPLGAPAAGFSENFDLVSVPALPAGWTVSFSGAGAVWASTNMSGVDTAPNALFAPAPGQASVNALVSPIIHVRSAPAQLVFHHNYDFERGWDGGVLEISIGGGDFADLLDAGGSFVTNGYNVLLSPDSVAVLAGRKAWSGSSTGWVVTTVQLPSSAINQDVQFRWRCATDSNTGGAGWLIDSVSVLDAYSCCMPDQIVDEDTSTAPISIPLGAAASSGSLAVTASSANNTLVPNDALVLGGSVSTPSLTITPAVNQFGVAPITVTINSTLGTVLETFNLIVNAVNDPPSFTKGADQWVAQGAGAQSIDGWATGISAGPNEDSQNLNFIVSSDNPDLFSVPPAIDAAGRLTFTTASSQRGAANVTVRLHDDGGTAHSGSDTSAAQSFTITAGFSTDTDGDGMPDDFELAAGLDPNNPGDGGTDWDGDGFTSIQEFWAGTDPLNSRSSLRVVSTGFDGSGMSLGFSSASGRQYTIEANDDFPDGSWSAVAGSLSGGGLTIQSSDLASLGLGQRIYRVSTSFGGVDAIAVSSDSVGYYRIALLGDSDTLLSIPFARPAAELGVAVSVSANTIQVRGAPDWSPNQWAYGGTQTNTYYLLVRSGSQAGDFFTITGNSFDTLTLDLRGGSLSGVQAGDKLSIVPYWTLGSIFPGGNGINTSPSPGNHKTEILLPDLASDGINLSATKIYYYWNGAWRQSGQGTAVKNDDVILPDMYVWVRNNSADATELITCGTLVANDWRFYVKRITSGRQDNNVALPWIVPCTLNDSGLSQSGAFRSSASPGNHADELLVFDNTVAAKNKSASAIYYFWNSAWRKSGFGTADFGTDKVFSPGNGVILRAGAAASDAVWTTANRNKSSGTVNAQALGATDTDGDGVSDGAELLAGTDPLNPASVTWKTVASWRFQSGINGDSGQIPLVKSNVTAVAGFEDNGVQFLPSSNPVALQYRATESSGRVNLSGTRGTIRFRVKPFWFSNDPSIDFGSTTYGGNGPGTWVTLVQTTNLWLRIDPNGTNLVLTSRGTGGQTVTNIQAKIIVRSQNQRSSRGAAGNPYWYQCILTYSPEQTTLYWRLPDIAQLVPATKASGAGVPALTSAELQNSSIAFGSALSGAEPVNGVIDEIIALNAPAALYTASWLVSAVQSTNPPGLNLIWSSPTNLMMDIKRRIVGSKTWDAPIVVVGTNYLDTAVIPGQRYEYNLNSGILYDNGFADPAGEYLTGTLAGAPIEDRGQLLLLIDQTLTNSIQADLSSFITNLVGDGWQVIRADVPRHVDDYTSSTSYLTNYYNITNVISPLIRSNYNRFSTNLKYILILGHVTVPYTGTLADDGHYSAEGGGHGAHVGVWSSDIYYGDVDGIWSDSLSALTSTYSFNYNYPRDGKFDDDYIPENLNGIAEIEIPVARIDFSRLPSFSDTEAVLLAKYLKKDVTYRSGLITFAAAAMQNEYLSPATTIPQQTADEMLSKSAVMKKSVAGDVLSSGASLLFGVESGPGAFDRINDALDRQHTAADVAAGRTATNCAFYYLRGSYFPDWNVPDDFIRAVLGTTNGGLTSASIWKARTWRADGLAAGFNIGHEVQEVINDWFSTGSGFSQRASELFGDPTLRYPVLRPPELPTRTFSGNSVTLSWLAPSGLTVSYYVYRSTNGIAGPFERLTAAPLSVPQFTDASPPSGSVLYMVRALQRVTTGSGSYTNISQGVFIAK